MTELRQATKPLKRGLTVEGELRLGINAELASDITRLGGLGGRDIDVMVLGCVRRSGNQSVVS